MRTQSFIAGLVAILAGVGGAAVIIITICLLAGCDDKLSGDEYRKAYADPLTGVVAADGRWACPSGYALVSWIGANYDPICISYVTATKIPK